jgi:alpha-acetolactate decarboxylase
MEKEVGMISRFCEIGPRGRGHLRDIERLGLTAQVQHLADFRMAIPESLDFLKADLTGDPSKALDKAERDHQT